MSVSYMNIKTTDFYAVVFNFLKFLSWIEFCHIYYFIVLSNSQCKGILNKKGRQSHTFVIEFTNSCYCSRILQHIILQMKLEFSLKYDQRNSHIV